MSTWWRWCHEKDSPISPIWGKECEPRRGGSSGVVPAETSRQYREASTPRANSLPLAKHEKLIAGLRYGDVFVTFLTDMRAPC